MRWIFAAGAVAAVSAALAVVAALRFYLPQVENAALDVSEYTQEQLDAHFAALNSAWTYAQIMPWLATSALLGLVAVLALVGVGSHRAQRASASATASRDAS